MAADYDAPRNAPEGDSDDTVRSLAARGPQATGLVADLDDGDLKYHTDFRQVYATLLDRWLHCPSVQVLGDKFVYLPLLK